MDRLAAWFEADLKAEGGEGVIEGYASTFGELDLGGDIVVKGAYLKTLRERKSARIPMLYGHNQGAIPVGVWTEMREDAKGLRVRGRLAIESEQPRQLYQVLKSGGEMGISIGYKAEKWSFDEKRKARLLEVIDLREVSLVPIPMCDSARVDRVKTDADNQSAAALIRALSSASEHLQIITALSRATRSLEDRS